jgi:predicted transcriptional regulator
MKNKELIKKKILEEDDYIYCPRLGNSLTKLLESKENVNGVSDDRICKVLLISQDELEKLYQQAIDKLKKMVGDS